jgi:hypothetical protein
MMSDELGPEPVDDEAARHCKIKIDGLPGQLPSGTYRMTFAGMEYRAGDNRPVIRFRFLGREDDHGLTAEEQAILDRQMATTREQALAIQHERDKASRLMEWPQPSDEELAVRAADARRAHPHDLKSVYEANRQAEAEGWLPPREEERNTWPIMDLSQQPPDLYQVGFTEVVNVTKLARVIGELLRRGLVSEADIGLPLEPRSDEGWGQQVERWLRS